MKSRLRRWGWPIAKVLVALAILVGVGSRFHADLTSPDAAELEIRWPWAFLAALLYLLGLSFSGVYWIRLLRVFGQKPGFLRAYRAYFIGHLGKYVPGKAVALILRGSLVSSPEVRLGVAILTAFYEVLTTLAAGVLVSAVIFIVQPPALTGLRWHPVSTGLLLLVLVGLPLLPGVFNRLTTRMARRFPLVESYRLPRIGGGILVQGLLLAGVGWCCLGLGVWSILAATLPDAPALTGSVWMQYTAVLGLAYVAGFLAIVVPGGVGVREYFLLELLSPLGPVAAAVLLLRLVWTAAEVAFAGVLFFLEPETRNKKPEERPPHQPDA